jgi:uncharacterized protein affecting Mg2+/Co2+ transport
VDDGSGHNTQHCCDRVAALGAGSIAKESRYVWSYTIEIRNHRDITVELKTRHPIITDAVGAQA